MYTTPVSTESLGKNHRMPSGGRSILLVEPNYRNKYPPLGLMKLATYHKRLGDSVAFFKGSARDYLLEEKFRRCITKINALRLEIPDVQDLEAAVKNYLKYRRTTYLKEALGQVPFTHFHTVDNILRYYAYADKPDRHWDRVYVTTLFTFYWKETKEAIELAKKVAKSIEGVYVGGIAASLIPKIISKETGLVTDQNIIMGLLDRPGIFDDNAIIIDELTPDYSILDTAEYKYPLDTGYLTYMTRGCTRHCHFCAVPRLEPTYKPHIAIKHQLEEAKDSYGDRKDLILMDNNVLASPEFENIIEEILALGFTKNATFVEPNYFSLWTKRLSNENDPFSEVRYLSKLFAFLEDFGKRRIQHLPTRTTYYQLLHDAKLDTLTTFTVTNLQASYDALNEYVEKYRNKAPKKRYVDFNQGIDCRYVDEEKMLLLSQLPIKPMRIAFDHLSLKDTYIHALELADAHGVKDLSNYILFNYNTDKPEHLWERLKINVDLNQRLSCDIFSFPMKYIPLYGKNSLDRNFVGKYWNRKYLRAVQCILNVKHGIGMTRKSFFEKAFGRNLDEYFEILMLPESYILYRFHFERTGAKDQWEDQYKNLTHQQTQEANQIILANAFTNLNGSTSKAVKEFIELHYLVKYTKPDKEELFDE
ncbi:MAG: hypothetical protein ACP5SH_06135 [Syntrophobacteraceae bacterium]